MASTSQNLDASQLGILLCAVIILAVISHRLPHMVAGMVVGGGHNGAIGGVGMMTLFAAGMTGMSLAGRLSGNPAAMLATEGVGEGAKMLQDRIAAAEAAMGSQNPQASTLSASSYESAGASSTSIGSNSSGFGTASPMSWYGRRSGSGSATSAASKTSVSAASSTTSGAEPDGGGKAAPAEPPQERPMSADEARGFGPDGNGGSGDQPYTPTSDDQVS